MKETIAINNKILNTVNKLLDLYSYMISFPVYYEVWMSYKYLSGYGNYISWG